MPEVSRYCVDPYRDREDAPGVRPRWGWQDSLHRFQEFPHQLTGADRGGLRGQDRARGWVLHRNGRRTRLSCAKPGRGRSGGKS